MVQGGKVLCQVKGNNTSFIPFTPSGMNQVGKIRANPDLVDLKAAKSIFRYLVHWSSQPETIQFLASLPQECSLLDAQYEYMQHRFSEIGLYPLLPPLAANSPSPMDPHSFPPPTVPAKAPVTSAAGAIAGGSAEESSGITCAPGAGMSHSACQCRHAAETRVNPLPQVPFEAPAQPGKHVQFKDPLPFAPPPPHSPLGQLQPSHTTLATTALSGPPPSQ